jgi:GAF domain-containing protein
MLPPPTPEDEPRRLAALHALRVLDTAPEQRFERITRTAARLLRVPIALVSLIDAERQWFKSRYGLFTSESPRRVSFCGHAILNDEIMLVEDALEDERFRDNPSVTGPPHVRFYAGRPLHAPEGERVGTLCLIDREPRRMTESELLTLDDLAQWVEVELDRGAQLRAVEHHLIEVLGRVAEPALAADSSGRLLWANAALAQRTGWSPAELAGMTLTALLGDSAPVLPSQPADGQRVMLATRAGARQPASVTLVPLEYGGQRRFTLIFGIR